MKLIAFHPEVAQVVGVNSASFIHQIFYWVSNGYGKKVNGNLWIYNSTSQWQKQFPYLAVRQIQRNIKRLFDEGFILKQRMSKVAGDHRYWYRLNKKNSLIKKFYVPEMNSCSSKEDASKMSQGASKMSRGASKMSSPYKAKATDRGTEKTGRNQSGLRRDALVWFSSKGAAFHKSVEAYTQSELLKRGHKIRNPQGYGLAIIINIYKQEVLGDITASTFVFEDTSIMDAHFKEALTDMGGTT